MIPAHERRILEAHVRGVALNRLDLEAKPLNEYEAEQLKDLIKLRMRGLPLQYLTGSTEFYGRTFYVHTGVLVPRPETEGLVERILGLLPEPQPGLKRHGLDVGVGSGCIALTLAMERSDLLMVGTECSGDALSVAEENARKLRTANADLVRVSEEPHLWQYEGFAPMDVIVSNPPYLMKDEDIAKDVLEHEPHEALFAPDGDPLYYYRFLAKLMDQQLAPGGFGAFEIAEQRGAETAAVFAAHGYKAEVFKDLTDRDRYLIVRRS